MNMGRRVWEAIFREHLPILGWTTLAVLYRGYAYAVGDQNLYLPFVLHWNDPSIFPNDYLLWLKFPRESLTWVTVAWLARLMDLQTLLLALYLITSYLTIWAAFRLGVAWFNDRLKAWVLVMLWTPVYELPGSGQDTADPYFTARNLAYMLSMWALVALVRSRPAGVIASLCAGSLVHVISEIQIVAACGLLYLRERRIRWFLSLFGAMTGCVALLIWWSYRSPGGHDMWGFYDPAWYAVAARGARILFPDCWGLSQWCHTAVAFGAYTAFAFHTRWHGRWSRADQMGLTLVISSVLLGLVSVWGAIFRMIFPVQLSLMRGHLFIVLMATMGLASVIGTLTEKGRLMSLICGASAAALWMSDNANAQWISMVVAVIAVEFLEPASPLQGVWQAVVRKRRLWALVLVLVVVGLSALDFYFGVLPELAWPRQPRWLGMGAFVVAVAIGGLLFPSRWKRLRVPILFAAFIAMSFMEPGRFAIESLGRLPALKWFYAYSRSQSFLRYRYTPLPKARIKLAALVTKEVPPDATVIVPLGWENFRLMTGRSSFVTQEDMVPAEFQREYAMEWRKRYTALYGANAMWELHTGSPALGSEALLALAELYRPIRLEYLICDRIHPLPVVGQVGAWRLYRMVGRQRTPLDEGGGAP
jgi:hypothetical protein